MSELPAWTVTIPAPARWLSANQRVDLRRQTPDRRAWRTAGQEHARAAAMVCALMRERFDLRAGVSLDYDVRRAPIDQNGATS